MHKAIIILLPEKISILRDKKNQDLITNREEYSIYYKNIIYPYSEEYDIQIECRYGKNLGHCWRINEFNDDMNVFDFTIKIYKDFGELIAEKSCKIEIIEKKSYEKINLLCIGDSMTRSEIYIQHAVNKARNISTVGLRNIALSVNHEGRGGWTSYAYFERFEDNDWGVSPFLFPKGYEGEEYFGSEKLYNKLSDDYSDSLHSYNGMKAESIKDGMLCLREGSLYRYTAGEYVKEKENPEFEFSFKKYIERFGIEKPNIVSLLFGANEFQCCKYEDLENELKKFISTLNKMILSIKEYDENIKIIVNMPVCGGDQYSWGSRMGCTSSSKQYDYCIKMAGNAILKEFDERSSENIFVCPMIAVCDTVAGFSYQTVKSNIYSDRTETHCANWVHPSEVGYMQMGDALAAVINSIRKEA